MLITPAGWVPASGTPGFPHFLAARWNAGEPGLILLLNSRAIDPSMSLGSEPGIRSPKGPASKAGCCGLASVIGRRSSA